MTYQHPFRFELLLVGAILSFCGCTDVVQDAVEIPATIGQVQEIEKPASEVTQQSAKSTELTLPPETAEPSKKDLATILREEKAEFARQTIEIPGDWVRMSTENHIWADEKNKRVIVRGATCLDRGLLEMFACPRDTKEHEAIISIHAKAVEAHTILLAFGINPGRPMLWFEKYYPVSGPVMNIEVWWTDKDNKLVKRRAQDMILNRDTGKPMKSDFVFGGSEQVFDPYTKKHDYLADFGPFINVANQPDAMIDVSIESSDEAQGALFEANTKNLPPVNTKVYIVISDSGKRIKTKITPEVDAKLKEAMERREPPGYVKPTAEEEATVKTKVEDK